MQFSTGNLNEYVCDDEPNAIKSKTGETSWDTNHWSLPQRCEKNCLGFVSCYHAKLLEWLLNLGEKVVPVEDIGLSTLSWGHEDEEATDDKHAQPGYTETVEEPIVLTNYDV